MQSPQELKNEQRAPRRNRGFHVERPATKGYDDTKQWNSMASCNDKAVHNKSCCAAWTHIDWSRQLHIFIYVYIYGYINSYTDVCVSVYIYMSINISIYIYTRVIYIYIYISIYIHYHEKKGQDNLQWPGSGQASSHKRLWRHEAMNLKWSCNDLTVHNESCCAARTCSKYGITKHRASVLS